MIYAMESNHSVKHKKNIFVCESTLLFNTACNIDHERQQMSSIPTIKSHKLHTKHSTYSYIQWNPSKMDTIGEMNHVLYMEVSLFKGFLNFKLMHETDQVVEQDGLWYHV